jgi:hypothetical protein
VDRAGTNGERSSRLARRAADRSKSDVLHGVKLGGSVIAALLSLAVLLGSGWAWAQYRSFSADDLDGRAQHPEDRYDH